MKREKSRGETFVIIVCLSVLLSAMVLWGKNKL